MVIKGAPRFIENKPYIGTVLSKAMQMSLTSMNIGFGHTTLGDFCDNLSSARGTRRLERFKTFRRMVQNGDKYKDEGEYLAGQLPRYGVEEGILGNRTV